MRKSHDIELFGDSGGIIVGHPVYYYGVMDPLPLSRDDDSISLETQRKIDELCTEYERSWSRGSPPRLDEFLFRMATAARPILLRQLLEVELDCRRRTQLTDNAEALIAEYPQLADDLRPALGERQRSLEATREAVLADPQPGQVPVYGQGLRIRCPHCFNQVEIIPDAPLGEIECPSCGTHFSVVGDDGSESQDLQAITTIGHFELLCRIGMGGFGTVWKARDVLLGRIVALKIPRKAGLSAREAEKFIREAQAAAHLSHPNIVQVYEVGRDGDRVFIASELVRGAPLASFLKEHRFSVREAAELTRCVALALDHAHGAKVIHRDLKPHNIMLDDQRQPHIVDFGLAKQETNSITMTVDGQVFGTPTYMSPEQARGEGRSADQRTDIYSLGVVLYELLTGEVPFRGSQQMLIHQILNDDPISPRKLNGQVSRDLETICLKCLEKRPANRYSSALLLADDLARYLGGLPIYARPISTLERAMRWCRRHPARATASAMIGLLAVGGPMLAWHEAYQRHTLAVRESERHRLIERLTEERDRLASRQTDVDQILADQIRPFEINPDNPTLRQKMLVLVRDRYQPLIADYLAGPVEPHDRALVCLGWGMIQCELNSHTDAEQSLVQGIDILSSQQQAEPTSISRLSALADGWMQLARTQFLARRLPEAIASVQQSHHCLERLIAKSPTELAFQSGLIDSQILLANIQQNRGKTLESIRHLQLAGRHIDSLPRDASNRELDFRPSELYSLACVLAHRQPWLLQNRDE